MSEQLDYVLATEVVAGNKYYIKKMKNNAIVYELKICKNKINDSSFSFFNSSHQDEETVNLENIFRPVYSKFPSSGGRNKTAKRRK